MYCFWSVFVSGTYDLYRPQRSWGKVIFSQASVILSTRGVPGPGRGLLLGGVPGPGGGCLVPGGVPGGDPPP